MILYGLLRNEHFLGDFLVLVALRDEDDNFPLPLAQLSAFTVGLAVRMGGLILGWGGKLATYGRGGVRIEPDFACIHLLDTFFDQVNGALLEQNARATQFHSFDEFFLVICSRKEDDF